MMYIWNKSNNIDLLNTQLLQEFFIKFNMGKKVRKETAIPCNYHYQKL